MADATSIQIIGDWQRQMDVPLKQALLVGKDVFRRSGPKAVKQAVVWMAQSASKITPRAKKNRKVERDGSNGGYVNTYAKNSRKPVRVYQHQFRPTSPRPLEGTWEAAKKVASAGMAKRSWLWGLTKGRGRGPSGTSSVSGFKIGTDRVGYVKRNKLDYILKIMPTGWLGSVTRKATNRILGAAANRMKRDHAKGIERIRAR